MGHLKLIYPLKMVIFHSYVSLPEVSSTNFHFHWILNVFFLFFSTISSGAVLRRTQPFYGVISACLPRQ